MSQISVGTWFFDQNFILMDGTDPTKIAQFDSGNISTGTTRTFTFPNANGTLALGTGTANYVAFWSSTNTLSSNSLLQFDGSTLSVGTNSILAGYTKLGDDASAPSIKTKIITGTTASQQGNQVAVSHGIADDSKILEIRTLVDFTTSPYIRIPASYTYSAGYEFSERISNGSITISNTTSNSANILSKPFTTLIIYQQ